MSGLPLCDLPDDDDTTPIKIAHSCECRVVEIPTPMGYPQIEPIGSFQEALDLCSVYEAPHFKIGCQHLSTNRGHIDETAPVFGPVIYFGDHFVPSIPSELEAVGFDAAYIAALPRNVKYHVLTEKGTWAQARDEGTGIAVYSRTLDDFILNGTGRDPRSFALAPQPC